MESKGAVLMPELKLAPRDDSAYFIKACMTCTQRKAVNTRHLPREYTLFDDPVINRSL
jgi:hypothetical protein